MTYTIPQREGHAEQAILLAAAGGWLDKTSCTQIAHTYGVVHMIADLKKLKGQLFPEFAMNGEGK